MVFLQSGQYSFLLAGLGRGFFSTLLCDEGRVTFVDEDALDDTEGALRGVEVLRGREVWLGHGGRR
jgi:hypothetical protein